MNYYTFIEKYKNTSIKELPLTEVDILIFSQLAYLSLTNFDFSKNNKYSLQELADNLDRSKIKESIIAQYHAMQLLDTIKNIKRYANILVADYEYSYDENSQFGALSFLIPSAPTVIAFEGTNCKLSGWKEDAILSYKYPTISQELAGKYIEKVISKEKTSVIVCGHSKGGNLALVGAMRTTLLKKFRIKTIYSFDGPGLREKEFNSLNYKMVKNRLHNIIPSESLIGVLFNQENLEVVASDAKGIMQHAANSWQVDDTKLLRTKKSTVSDNLDKAISNWLDHYNLEERELIIEQVFNLFYKCGLKNVHDLTDNHLKGLFEVLKASKELDNETKVVILNCLKLLSTTISKTLFNIEIAKIKKMLKISNKPTESN